LHEKNFGVEEEKGRYKGTMEREVAGK